MWRQVKSIEDKTFKIFVVSTIDLVIKETFISGPRDLVYVPINEAKRYIERNGNGFFIATDDSGIAQQYELKLLETKYK